MDVMPHRYPSTAGSALIECPVHGCCVVLGDDGRINTKCPHCLAEAVRARAKMREAVKAAERAEAS